MNRFPGLTIVALSFSLTVWAQSSSPAASSGTPASQVEKQSNAASATQDNSAISGDQVTKPAGAKSSTVIGCLDSPDADGHLMLRSMQYRSGVEVVGPNNLGSAAGQKVKLTGQWVATPESQDAVRSQDATNKKNRRFQATSFEVLADRCRPPAETTPVSKKKQKQQKPEAASQNNR